MSDLLKKLWDKNAGVKNDRGFPEGKRIPCILESLKTSVAKGSEDDLDATFNVVTIEGTDKDGNAIPAGKRARKTYNLYDKKWKNDKGEGVIEGEEQIIRMMQDLHSIGYSTKDYSFDEIQTAINDPDETVYIYVNAITNQKSGYQNIYLSYAIPENEIPVSDEEYEEDEEDEEDEEEPDSDEVTSHDEEYDEEEYDEDEEDESSEDEYDDEEDYDEEEGDEDEFIPERGMLVKATPPRCKKQEEYKVVSVSTRNQWAKLKRNRDDKVYAEVPFDLIYEEV